MSYDPNQPPPPAGHQPPGYGPPPPHFPPVLPAKKKRPTKLILGITGGALLLCCAGGGIIAALGAGDAANPSGAGAPATTNGAPAAPGNNPAPAQAVDLPKPAAPAKRASDLNRRVRDGKFEFTVTRVTCGATKLGGDFMAEEAQGQFCQVDITVANIGKEAQTLSGSSQKAFDAAGTEFSNDTAAEYVANSGGRTFLAEINPGNRVKGTLVFDVPKGTKLTALELHDSAFSGGVKVIL